MVDPLTAGAAVVSGFKLVKQSVDFIKQNISTAKDIGDLIGHIDKAMAGEQQAIKARDKANVDVFAVENVAKEVVEAKLAQEALYDLSQLIDHRFGYGTWRFILAERKKRIDAKKQAIKDAEDMNWKAGIGLKWTDDWEADIDIHHDYIFICSEHSKQECEDDQCWEDYEKQMEDRYVS